MTEYLFPKDDDYHGDIYDSGNGKALGLMVGVLAAGLTALVLFREFSNNKPEQKPEEVKRQFNLETVAQEDYTGDGIKDLIEKDKDSGRLFLYEGFDKGFKFVKEVSDY